MGDTGDIEAEPSGRDRRSVRIERQAEFILAAVGQTPDINAGGTAGQDDVERD